LTSFITQLVGSVLPKPRIELLMRNVYLFFELSCDILLHKHRWKIEVAMNSTLTFSLWKKETPIE
jgi:hypothetical protein